MAAFLFGILFGIALGVLGKVGFDKVKEKIERA